MCLAMTQLQQATGLARSDHMTGSLKDPSVSVLSFKAKHHARQQKHFLPSPSPGARLRTHISRPPKGVTMEPRGLHGREAWPQYDFPQKEKGVWSPVKEGLWQVLMLSSAYLPTLSPASPH